jgi:hypothetical protein
MSYDVSLSALPKGVKSLLDYKGKEIPLGPIELVRTKVEQLFDSISWTDESDKFFHANAALGGSTIEVSLSKKDPCNYVGFSLRGKSGFLGKLLELSKSTGWSIIDDQEMSVLDESNINSGMQDWENFRDSIDE